MLPEPRFGPYVPPEGGTIEATILVKAAPEWSKKYGETVCTAAILDDGRLVRLYPVPIDEYWSKPLPKYERIRVAVKPSGEPARRPESHILNGPIQGVASDLTAKPTPWKERLRLIAPAINPGGMHGLRTDQKGHRTSVGIVKVRELIDFYLAAPLDEIIEQGDYRVSEQKTLTGEPIMEGHRTDRMAHVFYYEWRCHGPCCTDDAEGQGYHRTTCEDWELFQSFRKWREEYPDVDVFLEKFKLKFYDMMGTSDLHFIMGTPSHPAHQDSWMVIGLVYPGLTTKPESASSTLCTRTLDASGVLRPKDSRNASAHEDRKRAKPVLKGSTSIFDF